MDNKKVLQNMMASYSATPSDILVPQERHLFKYI